jgi:hypothetical protein
MRLESSARKERGWPNGLYGLNDYRYLTFCSKSWVFIRIHLNTPSAANARDLSSRWSGQIADMRRIWITVSARSSVALFLLELLLAFSLFSAGRGGGEAQRSCGTVLRRGKAWGWLARLMHRRCINRSQQRFSILLRWWKEVEASMLRPFNKRLVGACLVWLECCDANPSPACRGGEGGKVRLAVFLVHGRAGWPATSECFIVSGIDAGDKFS